MIYELREYVAVPGKRDQVLARFADHTMALFAKHGMEVVGFWVDRSDADRLVYVLQFPDDQTLAAAWEAFRADPAWQEAKAKSEANGPIVAEVISRVLVATPFGPQGRNTR